MSSGSSRMRIPPGRRMREREERMGWEGEENEEKVARAWMLQRKMEKGRQQGEMRTKEGIR